DLLAVWIDGVKVIEAASPGPAPPWSFNWTQPVTLTLLGDYPSLSGWDTGGRIANVALWRVGVSSADMVSATKGAPPPLVRPSELLLWAPLVGAPLDYRGHALTTVGTTSVAHPPSFWPTSPRKVHAPAPAPASTGGD